MSHTTQLYRDYFINHEIRIPSLTNQDFMESKAGFKVSDGFFRGSIVGLGRLVVWAPRIGEENT